MTLRHMKIVTAVFRNSNITRAAEELHLAQPSVSLAIKELEEYYGIRLFERIAVSYTHLGRRGHYADSDSLLVLRLRDHGYGPADHQRCVGIQWNRASGRSVSGIRSGYPRTEGTSGIRHLRT